MKNTRTIAQMARTAAVAAALVSLLMVPAGAAAEGNSEMKLTVTATVAKHASLKVLAQPSSVVITAQDIARGYVDVPSPAQVAIKNNSDGYMLVFAGQGEFVRQVRVRGLGSDVQMGADGGVVSQRVSGRGTGSTVLDLGFRFELSASAQQGVYPWPMQMSVVPL